MRDGSNVYLFVLVVCYCSVSEVVLFYIYVGYGIVYVLDVVYDLGLIMLLGYFGMYLV